MGADLPINHRAHHRLLPGVLAQALKNTSASWNLEEIRTGKNVPMVLEPAEPVGTASGLRVMMEPGDLLCFSGAHLHASVSNATGVARFSVEMRTADAEDKAAGRGAANLDGDAPRVALDWFRNVMDGIPMPAAMQNGG